MKYPTTIAEHLRIAARFLRMRLAARRASACVLVLALAALAAYPALWMAKVPGAVYICAAAMVAGAFLSAASALVVPARETAEIAAAVFLDRSLRFDDRLLSILEAGGTPSDSGEMRSQMSVLLRTETEGTLSSFRDHCPYGAVLPAVSRYGAAAVAAWVCVVLLMPVLAPGGADAKDTSSPPVAEAETGEAVIAQPGRTSGGNTPAGAADPGGAGSDVRSPDIVRPATASAAGAGAGTSTGERGASPGEKEATLTANAILNAIGIGPSLPAADSAEQCAIEIERMLLNASAEERARLIQRLRAVLDPAIADKALLEELAALSQGGESSRLRETIERIVSEAITSAPPGGCTGGSAAGAGVGGTDDNGSEGAGAVSLAGATDGASAQGNTASGAFAADAVRAKTERALKQADWSARHDEVVRRFFGVASGE
ncbi:MAG: hypothetical protein RDV41_00395 [Planctomycetota bacterium]|nr:hypothetical protein [Planctomycetota bacterium]